MLVNGNTEPWLPTSHPLKAREESKILSTYTTRSTTLSSPSEILDITTTTSHLLGIDIHSLPGAQLSGLRETYLKMASRGNKVAFAFDIDGVLVNGKNSIPGARETLLRLQENCVPFIFLTNSGGVTEKENLDKLSLRLGDISFRDEQMVQSHAPFHALVEEYGDKTVLVLGGAGDNIRKVATAYGFKDVVTSSDLLADNGHTHPFPEMTRDHHAKYGRKVEEGQKRQISAIMCWSSPRDWCLDIQLVLDLLLSEKGIPGTQSSRNGNESLPNCGYQSDDQPKLFFCNGDFVWSTQHPIPRLAQGGFLQALKGAWAYATNDVELLYCICGKPTAQTYAYGEEALEKIGGRSIKTVYMIGDNTESDIAGSNAFESRCGYQWRSVLVETGVYQAGTKPNITPTHIARNVAEAVEWAFADSAKEDRP